MPLSPEQRASFQRFALVTIVVLLALVASNHLTRLVQPVFAHDSFAYAHGMEDFALSDYELAEIEAEVQAELAAQAQQMEEEAHRMAEEARRMADEHRRMAEGQRCEIERQAERARALGVH